MKNVNYMLRREPDRTGEDKVVDLTAWKAEHLWEPEAGRAGGPGRRRDRRPVCRRNRAALNWAELAATLAVAAAFLALAIRVALF